jgi:hypothetical protein
LVARPKTARGPAGAKGRKSAGRTSGQWSGAVTRRSNALDLEKSVFTSSDPHKIALSLKRSAERSKRRKSAPYRSAMSVLTFYLNRAGRNLPKRRVRILERAKGELRKVFGRE